MLRSWNRLAVVACIAAVAFGGTVCRGGEPALVKPYDPARLAIGEVAPDIEALDLFDVPFKLSDYRGKIVVIDFWGDW